jgi:hypothetical protein
MVKNQQNIILKLIYKNQQKATLATKKEYKAYLVFVGIIVYFFYFSNAGTRARFFSKNLTQTTLKTII